MADINFGEPAEVKVPVVDTENKDALNSNPLSDVNTNASEIDDKGMSVEELNDPNKIKVTIADRDTPVIVLFGPPACGKTMTLIRLSRFLQKEGYTVRPDESFRPSFDRHYKEMCDNFDSMINSEEAAASTSGINFMLVKVLHEGRTLCQILEGPGEYYFKPESPHENFPKYVNAIINSNNRKIWAIMVEPAKTNERMNQMARNNYVSKIRQLKTKIAPSDKVVFVLNKVDETDFVVGPGNVKLELALKNTDYWYPNIFVPFKNQNPITKLWNPFNFDFCPFQTGDFSKAADGQLTFAEGHDVYPRMLWRTFVKRIRG